MPLPELNGKYGYNACTIYYYKGLTSSRIYSKSCICNLFSHLSVAKFALTLVTNKDNNAAVAEANRVTFQAAIDDCSKQVDRK